jgi:large subunit ribosomal protein L6
VRALIANQVTGVTVGFKRTLDIIGVGYRAAVKGDALDLQLQFSHPVSYAIPAGITIICPDPTKIEVSGLDKQRVGQVASEIRAYRPPEPYKGKGIKYSDEIIIRKAGKTAGK